MRVFVTGASGHIASAVIPELLSAGHAVIGLARSDGAAAAVRSLGADVRRGDLDDLDGLSAAVREADGVIHLAFKHEDQRAGDLASAVAADLRAIEAMGVALKGSDRPFVGTCATGALILAGFHGQLTERDVRPGGPRIDAENTVVALAEQGVRSSVVRLPPTVHSLGRFGFVSGLIAIARATGVAGYLGDGTNRRPLARGRARPAKRGLGRVPTGRARPLATGAGWAAADGGHDGRRAGRQPVRARGVLRGLQPGHLPLGRCGDHVGTARCGMARALPEPKGRGPGCNGLRDGRRSDALPGALASVQSAASPRNSQGHVILVG